jgi:2-methylisocitrate lyase-like PEP mutase family enzyme
MNHRVQTDFLSNLHIKGNPLILCNAWDAGSAKTIEKSGAQVIATSSWSVAAAHGYEDGEKLPLDLAIANLKRIVESVKIPVTFDLEGGYGRTPTEVKAAASKVIEAGAVGINFEDQIVEEEGLYSIEEQCERIKAVTEAAHHAEIPFFINARTDIFFKADPSTHSEKHVEEAVQRATAYAVAGANGFFTPGLSDIKLIEQLCKESPLPINIMLLSVDASQSKKLVTAGVSRISYGPGPYIKAMDALLEFGREILL